MRQFSRMEVSLQIARFDQQEAEFQELFTGWLNTDDNRYRFIELFDRGMSARNPFENCFFNRKELVKYLAHDGMIGANFGQSGEFIIKEGSEFIQQFIDWLNVNDNRNRLTKLSNELGDWSELLINAFWGNQSDEAIVNCFASYRIRQLLSRTLSKGYFENEEGSSDE